MEHGCGLSSTSVCRNSEPFGNWLDVENRYLGLAFQINGETAVTLGSGGTAGASATDSASPLSAGSQPYAATGGDFYLQVGSTTRSTSSVYGTFLVREGNTVQTLTAPSANAQIAEMTTRERQVLIGIALGYSNKRIAGNLGRSVKTIEKHRFKMMHRLGLQNAAAATRYAMDNGLLHGGVREPGPEHGSAEAGPSPEQSARSRRRTRTQD